ncbi:response regulator [Dyadobacter alkalitolerans]|uniref:response regulator n=1 Tax=Dyadobacter alkalitolerans TaxID=492736 RepID=UPI00146FB34F|nr:response regulator [Dyadobacter alkalitolerans]
MVNDKRTIYLVDDDDDDRMIIRQAVRELMDRVNIIEFSSGYDFLENLVGHWPSEQTLVLMDINMPRMSGLDVIKAMQSDPASRLVPVLAISTATDKTLIDRVIASGAYGYFEKPVTYEQIGELASNIKDFYISHYAAR